MALMAASRAEIPRETEDMPSVGCVIRRARSRGSPAVLAVGWNGFLPNTTAEELKEIKDRSFKGENDQKRDNALTAELGLHAETNALQYCSENPEMATVYVTHIPCYDCAKQLVAHKVGRVFYLYYMTYSEGDHESRTIRLFKKFNISCIPFSKRDKVLEDFSKSFLEHRGILRGTTDDKTPPESCPSFIDSRDRKPLPALQTLYTHV